MQSDSIKELATALSKAQGEFSAIPKGETNPFFKSKYAGLPDVIGAASKILSANGLSISQFICQNELGEDCLKTYLMHSSGEFIEHSMKLYLGKLDSQGMGSATTYARRYSYMSVLGLVADEDDDGNEASHNERPQTTSHERANQAQRNTARPASEDPRIAVIVEASLVTDDDFLNSLADQYKQRGSLTEKQMEAGFKKGSDVLSKTTTTRIPEPLREGEEPF